MPAVTSLDGADGIDGTYVRTAERPVVRDVTDTGSSRGDHAAQFRQSAKVARRATRTGRPLRRAAA